MDLKRDESVSVVSLLKLCFHIGLKRHSRQQIVRYSRAMMTISMVMLAAKQRPRSPWFADKT